LNPKRYPGALTITTSAIGIKPETTFMIDTGAAPSIVKLKNIQTHTYLNTEDILTLSGITTEKIRTLGSIEVLLHGYPLTLNVVNNNFPMPQSGILGSDFIRYCSKIDFDQKFILWQGIQIPFTDEQSAIIPPRSEVTLNLKVINPEIKTGYIPRLTACDGVFVRRRGNHSRWQSGIKNNKHTGRNLTSGYSKT
jgi:hypothetical protein